MIELGTAIIIGFIAFALILWKLAYQNGKLRELVKQKEAEIEMLLREVK